MHQARLWYGQLYEDGFVAVWMESGFPSFEASDLHKRLTDVIAGTDKRHYAPFHVYHIDEEIAVYAFKLYFMGRGYDAWNHRLLCDKHRGDKPKVLKDRFTSLDIK